MRRNSSQIITVKKEILENTLTEMLHKLKFESLEERRIAAKLTMAFTIINGYVILEPNLLPKQINHRPMRQCSSKYDDKQNQLLEVESKIKMAGYTVFYSVPKLWNKRITRKQANAPSVEAFKQYFHKY